MASSNPVKNRGKRESDPAPILLAGLGEDGEKFARALRKQGFSSQLVEKRQGAFPPLKRGGVKILVAREEGPPPANLQYLERVEKEAPGTGKILLISAADPKKLLAYANQGGIDQLLPAPATPAKLVQGIRLVLKKLASRHGAASSKPSAKEKVRPSRSSSGGKKSESNLSRSNRDLRKTLKEAEAKIKSLTVENQSLKIQSTTDPLTGLYNRREFLTRIRMEWGRYRRYNRPLSMIMLDIDHFKAINDTHGHECGDQVLQTLGLLIRRNKRAQDLCCRYGGEEFVVLLTETTLESAFHVAEGLRLLVEGNDFRYKGKHIEVRVSAGVCGAVEQHPSDVEAFINLSDAGMYRAKRLGRNRTIVIDPKDGKSILRHSTNLASSRRKSSS